ncbi:30S ribosomal protein S6, partial [Mycobacterium kansasii]
MQAPPAEEPGKSDDSPVTMQAPPAEEPGKSDDSPVT